VTARTGAIQFHPGKPRPRYQTPDMFKQGHLLNLVAERVDAGQVQSTLQTKLGTINAENLRKAHALVESGKTVGKIVLENF
jgi:NADPH:quinone reductase